MEKDKRLRTCCTDSTVADTFNQIDMLILTQVRQLERDSSLSEQHEWAEEVKELFLIGKWFYLTWDRADKLIEWNRICFYIFR